MPIVGLHGEPVAGDAMDLSCDERPGDQLRPDVGLGQLVQRAGLLRRRRGRGVRGHLVGTPAEPLLHCKGGTGLVTALRDRRPYLPTIRDVSPQNVRANSTCQRTRWRVVEELDSERRP